MNIDDPFGRLQQKHERSYEALRSSLQNKGVDNRPAAEAVLRNILKHALLTAAVLLLAVLAVALLFPGSIAIALVFAVLILFWIATTALNGRRLVNRYIEEELSE